jgi:hypothetical protein
MEQRGLSAVRGSRLNKKCDGSLDQKRVGIEGE